LYSVPVEENRCPYVPRIHKEEATKDGQSWFALHVKSRHEFVSTAALIQAGVETFLPSIRKLSQWKDRKKEIDFPLFPGYLFVHISPSPEDMLRVIKTRGAVTFVSLLPGTPSQIPSEEIESLRTMLNSGQEINLYPFLEKGTRVRVKRGPLQSAVGTIMTKEDHFVFLVNIDILGRSVGVKIYADDLESYC